jgi:Asp-tRNA(Asn)/Glu-tRNA(Gln) amidotransferase C subunit
MNLKNAIDLLRGELRKFSVQAPQSFADYTLEDGTVVRVDGELVEGTEVYVIADETVIPAPDGTHTIPDVGTIVTVGGKITEVQATPAAEPVAEVEVEAEITPEVATEVVEEIADAYPTMTPEVVTEIVAKHLQAIMDELKAAMTELGAQRKKMEAMASHMTTMADIVEKVSDLPTAPAAPSIPGIVENNKRRKEENFSALAATIQNMKRIL